MIIKSSIKNRFIILFIGLNILFISLFMLNNYTNTQQAQKIKKDRERDESIKISLIQSTLLLFDYHKKIYRGNRIDPQLYLEIVRETSSALKQTNFLSLKSYIKVDNKFIITASSTTKEEFRAKRYPKFGDSIDKTILELLNRSYNSDNFETTQIEDKLAIKININSIKYIVVVNLKNIDISQKSIEPSISIEYILIIISLLTLILIVILSSSIIKQIKNIETSLHSFFDYLINSGDKKDIKYIDKLSSNELGILSKNINTSIKSVVSKIDNDNSNREKDNIFIKELIEIIKDNSNGAFDKKVTSKASNTQLNKLKDSINSEIDSMNRYFSTLNIALEKYLKNNYTDILVEDNYRGKSLDVIKNINKLVEIQSNILVDRLELSSVIVDTTKSIKFYVENNEYTLNELLSSLKDILSVLESDYKFVFAFDNSLKVIRKENIYVNNLLDTFANKYSDSIALITDINMGKFENNTDAFISRLNSVVKDSSVRDEEAQKKLISKVKDITSTGLTQNSNSKIQELLELLVDELIKDIRYSLFLIEDKVHKLSSNSSSRVSSFHNIKDISTNIKDTIQDELQKSNKLYDSLFYIINKTDDIRYKLLDDYEFRGKSKIKEVILSKESK